MLNTKHSLPQENYSISVSFPWLFAWHFTTSYVYQGINLKNMSQLKKVTTYKLSPKLLKSGSVIDSILIRSPMRFKVNV